jgi:hypothetical protein
MAIIASDDSRVRAEIELAAISLCVGLFPAHEKLGLE